MVANSKPTRNSDHRHAQSIGRQRQAAQRAATDVSPQELADILPHDASPLLPDAAPVTTPADEAPADMPRPSWRDREPAIVHSVRWRDHDGHEHLHVVRAGTSDPDPGVEELPPGREVPSALHRGAGEPEAPCASGEGAP
jgi:hypothetical protein